MVAGGINTLITGAMLSALARVIDPRVAYTIVFAVGVVIAVATAGGFVFGVRLTPRLVALYVSMYVAVFLVGLAAVAVAVPAGMPRAWSGLVVFITAPLTFLGGRLLLVQQVAGRPRSERTPT